MRAAGAAFDPADFMAYTVLAKYRASQAASDSVVLAPLLPYFGDQAVQAEAAALAEAKAKADEAIAESFSPLSRWSSIPHHPCRSSGSGSLSSEPPPWTLAPWTWRARIFASEHELRRAIVDHHQFDYALQSAAAKRDRDDEARRAYTIPSYVPRRSVTEGLTARMLGPCLPTAAGDGGDDSTLNDVSRNVGRKRQCVRKDRKDSSKQTPQQRLQQQQEQLQERFENGYYGGPLGDDIAGFYGGVFNEGLTVGEVDDAVRQWFDEQRAIRDARADADETKAVAAVAAQEREAAADADEAKAVADASEEKEEAAADAEAKEKEEVEAELDKEFEGLLAILSSSNFTAAVATV